MSNSQENLPVGKQVRRQRILRDESQKVFAAASGISVRTLSKVERGMCEPKIETCLKIAGHVGLPPEQIFGNEKFPK